MLQAPRARTIARVIQYLLTRLYTTSFTVISLGASVRSRQVEVDTLDTYARARDRLTNAVRG